MRLIDADELKKELVDFMDAFIDSDGDMMYSDHLLIDADYIALCDYIDKQPTIHPKRGKWINVVDGIEYTWGICDKCGAHIPMPYEYYEYCPHCGADMQKEER